MATPRLRQQFFWQGLPAPKRTYQQTAVAVRDHIKATTGLPMTVAYGRTRTLAKLFAETSKPFGAVAVTEPEHERELLAKLPVTEIAGIGARRAARLALYGIQTCLDLARASGRLVKNVLTKTGYELWAELNGDPVTPIRTTRTRHKMIARGGSLAGKVRNLPAGQAVLLFQPRLEAELGGWRLRGDVDLVRLERTADGTLHVLIGDMKSTAEVKVEHRLQVAFYRLMLEKLLAEAGLAHQPIRTGILYRPPADPVPEDEEEIKPLRDAAKTVFGLDDALLEVVADPEAYLRSAHDLVLGADSSRPPEGGRLYTLDPCPNDWYGYWLAQVVNGLCGGQPSVLYDRLVTPPAPGDWAGLPGQAAFLAGLDAFRDAGLLHDFEAGKREFIGGHGRTPVLLVQGPPGTGKSYSTAFAVFARLQAAMAEGRLLRVFLSCKTHAAIESDRSGHSSWKSAIPRLMVLYAGQLAEEMFTGRRDRVGASSDDEQIADLIGRVTSDDEEGAALARWVELRTRNFLKRPVHWLAVRRVEQDRDAFAEFVGLLHGTGGSVVPGAAPDRGGHS